MHPCSRALHSRLRRRGSPAQAAVQGLLPSQQAGFQALSTGLALPPQPASVSDKWASPRAADCHMLITYQAEGGGQANAGVVCSAKLMAGFGKSVLAQNRSCMRFCSCAHQLCFWHRKAHAWTEGLTMFVRRAMHCAAHHRINGSCMGTKCPLSSTLPEHTLTTKKFMAVLKYARQAARPADRPACSYSRNADLDPRSNR